MNINTRAAILIVLAMAASGAPRVTAGPYEWQQEPDSVALRHSDRVVWKFNYGTNDAKPFFHPVALLDGTELTIDRPSDHRWHHGLWFSWKYINGINYWEENPATGKSAGLTEWSQPKIERRPDFSARITLNLAYRPGDGKPVLTEKRVIDISPPGSDGAYSFDWTLVFTPVDQDVLLERTPLPGQPDGQPWGGYAGLSMRFVNDMSDLRLVTEEGPAEFTDGVYRGRAMGLDYSGRFADHDAGVAMLDSPDNINRPAPWYGIANGKMNYVNAAVIQYQPLTIKAGQTLNLRYRVIVHPGRWKAGQLSTAFGEFISPKKH